MIGSEGRNSEVRIGLLGGSFNPAHEGHLHVSKMALARLGLDEVWWLVAPQNPLKPEAGMASFEERMEEAAAMAEGYPIRVSDLERRLGTRYTADTLAALIERHPRHRFVWLMGADNLIQVVRWKRWREIFHAVPVAVLARPAYSLRARSSKAARHFGQARIPGYRSRSLPAMRPPAWVFLRIPLHPASATAIRRERELRAKERREP